MTNREAFNRYLRLEAEKGLKCTEAVDSNALVRHSCKYDKYGVHVEVYDKLRWLRYKAVGTPIGSMDDVIAWLDEEASEEVLEFLDEFQAELDSPDRCEGCSWCENVLREYRR